MESTETYTYDERKKILTRTIHEKGDVYMGNDEAGQKKSIGTYKVKNEQVYVGEENIKKILKELHNQKSSAEHVLKKSNETLEATKNDEKDEELNKWIALHRKASTFANREQALVQQEMSLKNIKVCNEQILGIKTAIGARLKL